MAQTAAPWAHLKLMGNQAFGKGHFVWARLHYEASGAVDQPEVAEALLHHATLAANVAAVELKLRNHAAAVAAAQRGLNLFGGKLDDEAEKEAIQKLQEKLQHRQSSARSMAREESTGTPDESAEKANSEGGLLFRQGAFADAKAVYLRAAAVEEAPNGVKAKIKSNLAQVSLRLEEAAMASEYCEEAVVLLEAAESEPASAKDAQLHRTLREKVESRSRAAALLRAVLDNYRESLLVSTSSRTRLPACLRALVLQSPYLFTAGQLRVARWRMGAVPDSHRFMPTIGVLTCLTLFAWGRGADGWCIGFGCHVPIGCLLSGCLRQRIGRVTTHPLQEAVDTLRSALKDMDLSSTRLHIVGGHRYTDVDLALSRTYFPANRSKHSFAWHLIDAARVAGCKIINTSLANRFPGADITSQEVEQGLRDSGQRFVVAALDLETGYVITHTDEESSPVPRTWWAKERPLPPMGQPLEDAALFD